MQVNGAAGVSITTGVAGAGASAVSIASTATGGAFSGNVLLGLVGNTAPSASTILSLEVGAVQVLKVRAFDCSPASFSPLMCPRTSVC